MVYSNQTFSFYDFPWAMRGNTFKIVIKVRMLQGCDSMEVHQIAMLDVNVDLTNKKRWISNHET